MALWMFLWNATNASIVWWLNGCYWNINWCVDLGTHQRSSQQDVVIVYLIWILEIWTCFRTPSIVSYPLGIVIESWGLLSCSSINIEWWLSWLFRARRGFMLLIDTVDCSRLNWIAEASIGRSTFLKLFCFTCGSLWAVGSLGMDGHCRRPRL